MCCLKLLGPIVLHEEVVASCLILVFPEHVRKITNSLNVKNEQMLHIKAIWRWETVQVAYHFDEFTQFFPNNLFSHAVFCFYSPFLDTIVHQNWVLCIL